MHVYGPTTSERRSPSGRSRLARLFAVLALIAASLVAGGAPARAATGISFGTPSYDCTQEYVVLGVDNSTGTTPTIGAAMDAVTFLDRSNPGTSWSTSSALLSLGGDAYQSITTLPTGSNNIAFSLRDSGVFPGLANGTYSIDLLVDGGIWDSTQVTVSCPRTTVADVTASNVTSSGFDIVLSVTGQVGFTAGQEVTVEEGSEQAFCSAVTTPTSATYQVPLSVSCSQPPTVGVEAYYLSYGGMASGLVIGQFFVTIPSTSSNLPGAMVPLSPARVIDTRAGGGAILADHSRSVQVTGVGGVPEAGVAAVVLNVTVTQTTSGGYLTVFPTGTPQPTASNLNWSGPGVTIPNAVTVKIGTDGKVDVYQSGPGTAQVIIDVAGYYASGTVTQAGGFVSLSPSRILDTRKTGGPLVGGVSRNLQITGEGGVPASNVSSVVLNVTVTGTTTGGYLSVYPAGSSTPTASNLNWSSAGVTIPNLVVVKVGLAGKVTLFQSGPGVADAIVDVAGYFVGGTPTAAGMFVAVSPSRLLDTRDSAPLAGGADTTLSVLGAGGFPSGGLSAVVMNTTVTETKAGGYLTVYPGTISAPTASNLNWSGAGVTIPNLVTVQVGGDGTVAFHNGSSASTQVIADAAGYYIATSTG